MLPTRCSKERHQKTKKAHLSEPESETRTGTRAGHSSSCAGVAHGATHFLTFKIYAICVISRSVRPRRAYQTADGPRQLKEAVDPARAVIDPSNTLGTEVPISVTRSNFGRSGLDRTTQTKHMTVQRKVVRVPWRTLQRAYRLALQRNRTANTASVARHHAML